MQRGRKPIDDFCDLLPSANFFSHHFANAVIVRRSRQPHHKESVMNYVNTHKPTNRTLAVIDGGLNLKASVEPLITTQKPKCRKRVGMAMAISSNESFHRQSDGRKTPASSARIRVAKSGERSGAKVWRL
jgi:hypothetical protein